MRNYIILNGQNSNDINGLLIQSLPPITKPLVRTEIEEIDGRNGDIVTPLGYSSYNKEISIGLYGDFDINQIISYFNSDGTVIFSNEPDKYYYYQILDQIDFEKLIRFKTATVKLHCQPFKYAAFEGDYILDPPADNLMAIPDWTNTTNNITLTASNGTVTIKGKATAATEFYLPITSLSLSTGSYELNATSSGTNPNYCSIRLIGSAPADADSLGGKYVTLAEGTVTLQGTLPASKTFNYLWFYINAGQSLDFTVTFTLENQAQKVISGEGSTLALTDTAAAPFYEFDLKGDTYQQTYSGKNLFNIQDATGTRGNNTVVASNQTITVNSNTSGTETAFYLNDCSYISQWAPGQWENARDFNMTGMGGDYTFKVYYNNVPTHTGSTTTLNLYFYTNKRYILKSRNDIVDNTITFSVNLDSDEYIKSVLLYVAAGNIFNNFTIKTQLESGSTATSYEPYVGGIASPNPDYPQDIQVVKDQDMVRITGKNLVNVNELYLDASIERTSDGLRDTITSDTLATYYSGSVANPPGVYTVSFDARVLNPDEAILVLDDTASIWGIDDLTLRNIDGSIASEFDRTLSVNWKRYCFTVIAYTSEAWIDSRALKLYFSTYTNSPVFELRNLQIEAGTTATEFENSDTQMYPINFRTGKNMLSEDFLSMGDMVYGVPVPTVKYRVNDSFGPLKVKPNTTYTISAQLGQTVQGMRVGVTECDMNTLYLSESGWQQLASEAYTFTTGENTQFVKLLLSLSTTSSVVTTDSTEDTTEFDTAKEWLRGATIQVESGDTATAFEPYESMELCKIGNYQDYISKSGEDWYVHKEIGSFDLADSPATSSSPTWNYRGVVGGQFYAEKAQLYDYLGMTDKKLVCNCFTPEYTNAASWDTGKMGINRFYAIWVSTGDTSLTTQSQLIDWFNTHSAKIYYPLATPTDTKITNEETLEQLNILINQAHSYKGTTYISSLTGTTSNLPPIFAVEVAKSSDGVVTNSGNFPAKPKLTIYGSGNIAVNLDGNQIFQIALGDEGYITIDTAIMEAYQDSVENLKNRLVVGDYDNFTLNPGDNTITFSGVVTKCIVENYSRWL